MSYGLGIDLGTTFATAAVSQAGTVEIVTLGQRQAAVPSLIHFGTDGSVSTGEVAERRGEDDHWRTARDFRRRLGDETPILLAGTSFTAQLLTAHQLGAVYEHVVERQGGPPSSIVVTHPAHWGPFKIDRLREAIDLAHLSGAIVAVEPVAAAIDHHRRVPGGFDRNDREELEAGDVIAVYDLGGDTLDTTMLRMGADGLPVPLGPGEGRERLGGNRFDRAIFDHVRQSLDGALESADQQDRMVKSALLRLQRECSLAKEALSKDAEVTIPVALPGLTTSVRLTRTEFEDMIRPLVEETLSVLRQTMTDAGLQPDDVATVLLTGGSVGIPLIGELVSAEFGRPVRIDDLPRFTTVRGAARLAADSRSPSAFEADPAVTTVLALVAGPVTASPDQVAARPPGLAGHGRMRRPVFAAVVAITLLLSGGGAAAAFGAGPFDRPTAGPADRPTPTVDVVADAELSRTEDPDPNSVTPSSTSTTRTVRSSTTTTTTRAQEAVHHTTTTAHHRPSSTTTTSTAPTTTSPHHTTTTTVETTTTDPHHPTTTEPTTTPEPTTKEVPIPRPSAPISAPPPTTTAPGAP